LPLRALARALAAGVVLASPLLAGACARQARQPPLPAACSAGPEAVLTALRAAPSPVRLGGTPLSGCLARQSTGGDLQAVGSSFVGAATSLSERTAREPEGRAATELGYLVGAVERGSGGAEAAGTSAEVVRRVELELDAVPRRSRALRHGLRAGRSTG
jgi:hypothetical protein